MSNETGVPSGVSEALNNLLKHREERRARDREGLDRSFTEPPERPSWHPRSWFELSGVEKDTVAKALATEWLERSNRRRSIAWYVLDQIIRPVFVIAMGILSAVAVLVGMKM